MTRSRRSRATVGTLAWHLPTPTLKDPGCAYFFVTARRDDPSTIFLFEEFRSEEAFQKHVHAEPTVQFLASLQGTVEGDRPAVTLLRQSAGPLSALTAGAHSAHIQGEGISR
jgi:quinol monooxygenase YgiN